jgi:hypothetical protein
MKSVRWLQSSLLLGALGLGAAFSACQGSIGGPLGNGPGEIGGSSKSGQGGSTVASGTGGSGASGTSGGAGQTPGTPTPGALPPKAGDALAAESADRLVMRRLTNNEYDNIVAHLVGDTTQPGLLFPPDPIGVQGYDAPSGVADLNVQLYFQTAQTLIANAVAKPQAAGNQLVVPAAATGAAQTASATQFIQTFGLAAYRRPVAAAELSDLLTIVFQPAVTAGATFAQAIGYVAQAMLQSPSFLYHWEIGPTASKVDSASGLVPLTPWQVASRLSMLLWADMPDKALLAAAQNNQLATPAQVSAQALRMYADPRATQALTDFHLQWLLQVAGNVTQLDETTKASNRFTPAVAQSLTGEFTQFLSSVYSPSGDGTFRTLLTASYTYANPALAAIYGVTVPGTGFTKVQLDPTQRAGIFTQLAFLASQADVSSDNPIRRGLAVYENLLCGGVNPPPAVVPGLPTSIPAGQTTRQRFSVHAESACAQGCHTLFDPPGFAFENYDAIGAFRTTDNGSPVDATGSFTTSGGCAAGTPACGTTLTFTNAVDLVTQLASNPEAQWCTERNWFRYAVGRMETPAELGSLQLAYRVATANAGFSLRDMLTSLVTSKAFLYRAPSPGETL